MVWSACAADHDQHDIETRFMIILKSLFPLELWYVVIRWHWLLRRKELGSKVAIWRERGRLNHGVHGWWDKRLNTGMAPTCDWMIKIVKVNKLYFNFLLVSIVNRVYQSGTMKYQCEWKHRCVKQEMVTYLAKGRQPFLFSEVVQRYSGDEKVICWLVLLTKLI